MGSSLSLQHHALAVDPGGSVSTELRVRNTGDVVDQFSFQPLGDAAGWITVDPPAVRLFPETDATVTVTIAPPRRSSTTAGIVAWAVKAVPQEDPLGAAVAEGTADIGSFTQLGAELQPVTGRGRLVGRFELAVDNSGNVAVPVRINGTDAEQALRFEIEPPQLDTAPGSANFAKIRIRPEQRIWRGQPKNHPFQIVVEPQTAAASVPGAAPAAPIVVNGNLLQEPVFPKWLPKALLALLGLLLLLFVLWKTLLKPSVESAAREVAIEEVAPVSSAVDAIQPAVEEAALQAEQAAQSAQAAEDAAGAGGGGSEGGSGGLGTVFNETTAPAYFRLPVATTAGATNAAAAAPQAESSTFAITDLILQNPGGDLGRIRVKIDDQVVLESALQNFRDLDFHFVAPYVVTAGQVVSVEVDCDATQIIPTDPCDDAVSISGFATTTSAVPADSSSTTTAAP